MVRSCFIPTKSCTNCAPGLSLVTAHNISPSKREGRIQRSRRRLRRDCGSFVGGSTCTTTGSFAGKLTGFPHFRQNSASSGRVAPHLLHPNRTLVVGGVLFVGITTGSPHLKRSANSGEEMPADISTGWHRRMCPQSYVSRERLSGLDCASIQAEPVGDRLERLDAETDVLIQVYTQVGGTMDDVVAVHLAGEGFVFHPFSDRLSIDFRQRLTGLDQRDSGDESCKFIAGEESLFHGRVTGYAAVLGV